MSDATNGEAQATTALVVLPGGAWKKMRRSMLRDTKNFSIVFLLATNFLTAYHYLYAAWGDPRDYVTVNSSYGPMAYVASDQLRPPSYGPLQSIFHPGERVSYVTDLCVAPGVAITGRAQLVRPAQSGVGEAVVDGRTTDVPPSIHRCGPRVASFEFPQDALTGTYQIRRSVQVDADTSYLRWIWPLRMDLDPLVVQVVTAAKAAPEPDLPTAPAKFP